MADPVKNDFHSQAYLVWLLGQSGGKLSGYLNTEDFPEQQEAKFNYKFVKKLKGPYEPESVMNSIVSREGSNVSAERKQSISFFDLETHKLSSLVPEIRLYRAEGSALLPFYFPIVSDFSPLENNSTENTGAGYVGGNTTIENFSITYQGQDFFTSKRYLVCSLRIKVDSLANIFIQKKGYARLADLFALSTKSGVIKNSGGKSVLPGRLSKPAEVVAVLGYSFADHDGTLFSEQERREIAENTIPLRMNPGDHTINLGPDGTATIDIEYTARLDSFDLDRRSYSVFSTVEDILKEAEIKIDILEGEGNVNDTRESLLKLSEKGRNDHIKKKLTDKQSQVRIVTEIIEKANRFYYLNVKGSTLKKYLEVPYLNQDDISPPVTDAGAGFLDEALAYVDREFTVAPPPAPSVSSNPDTAVLEEIKRISGSRRAVHFFVFGDIVEAFCRKSEHSLMAAKQEVIRKSKLPAKDNPYPSKKKQALLEALDNKLKKLNDLVILLSDIVLVFADDKQVRINLADIPISSEIFQEFVFSEIINVSSASYSLKDFLKGCYSSLLIKALSGFRATAPYVLKNTEIAFTAVTYSAPEMRKNISSTNVSPKDVPGPNVFAGAKQIQEGKEYYVFYPQPNPKVATGHIGDKSADLKEGIYHFHLGKNRGLIKNISFSKFNVLFRREALLVNQINIYDELKMPYSANVAMFGNNLFMPGSQIYIDPFSIGFGDPRDKNSAAADLGLGGYYVVLTVRTTYSNNGTLTTNLECSFAAFPEGSASLSTLVSGLALRNSDEAANSTDTALRESGDTNATPDPPYSDDPLIFVEQLELEAQIERANPKEESEGQRVPGDARLDPYTDYA